MKSLYMRKFSFGRFGEGEGAGDSSPVVKTFTQDDINKAAAAARKDAEAKNKEFQKQLAELSVFKTESEEYKTKLEQLQASTMTKDELAARDAEKAKKKYEDDLKQAQESTGKYQSLFQRNLIATQVLKAAGAAGAFSDEQILGMVEGKAKVVEEDGEWVVKIPYTVTKKGETKQLELTPAQLLAEMKEDVDKYGNLFTSTMKGGTGGGNGGKPGSKEVDISKMSGVEYRTYMKEKAKQNA